MTSEQWWLFFLSVAVVTLLIRSWRHGWIIRKLRDRSHWHHDAAIEIENRPIPFTDEGWNDGPIDQVPQK